mgnify:CR=1 FL=1
MEENTVDTKVPYIVHESITTKLERTIEKLWILCIVLIVLLVGTNIAWIYYENQFEDTVITQDSNTGTNNYIGNDGDIINGKTDD